MKSYRIKDKLKSKDRKKGAVKDFVTGGVTALLGVALVSKTADAINRT